MVIIINFTKTQLSDINEVEERATLNKHIHWAIIDVEIIVCTYMYIIIVIKLYCCTEVIIIDNTN